MYLIPRIGYLPVVMLLFSMLTLIGDQKWPYFRIFIRICLRLIHCVIMRQCLTLQSG